MIETELYWPAVTEVFSPNHMPSDLQLLKALNKLVERKYNETRRPEFYCKALNVSLRTLNRLTMAYYNESLYQHLQSKVHWEVQRMLAHTTLTVKQITAEVGVSSLEYLCRDFKKRTGLRPSEYRKQYSMLAKI